jgi:hypothetical protein
MSNNITTYSKIDFNPLQPDKEKISIDDIAHSLSLMCRANGHIKEFFSVGQHSIYCCEEAIARGYSNTVALACLLHDGSEAYMADITRPVKKSLQKYLEIEEVLQTAIYEKYIGRKLSSKEAELLSLVDDAMLYNEFVHYMNKELPTKDKVLVSSPEFKFIEFSKVENRFKELFNELIKKCSEENLATNI